MAWSAPTEWERWNPEQLLECPYDSVHRIPAKRYQYHIIKCRKQHPEKDFVSCPFNAKHIMLRPELRSHITKCPEKSELEPYSWKGNEYNGDSFYLKGCTSVPSYRKEELTIQPEYEWDRDEEDSIANQYQYSTAQEPTVVTPTSRNNQAVQDVLSLKPEDREQFKNALRSRALQNNLEPPHFQTGSVNSDFNISRNVQHETNTCNGYTTCNENNSTRLSPQNGALNDPSSNQSLSTSLNMKSHHGVLERPLTYRGRGRARLTEEARRTQFGVTNSNIHPGQIPSFAAARRPGMQSFSEADTNQV